MNKIDTVLLELRVSPSLLGFLYLKSALSLCIKDPTIIRDVTGRLYPTISAEHKTTAPRVERAIRHAIEVSWA